MTKLHDAFYLTLTLALAACIVIGVVMVYQEIVAADYTVGEVVRMLRGVG